MITAVTMHRRTPEYREYERAYRARPEVKARRAALNRRYRLAKKLRDAGIDPSIIAREVALFTASQMI